MTIVYTGSFRFPAQDAAAARVLSNAKALRELGHEVVIVSWGGKPREEDKKEGKYIYDGFEYIHTGELLDAKKPLVKRIINLFNRGNKTISLLRLRKKTEVIIAYNPPFFFTKKCIRYCKKNSIRFVTDLTEWYAPSEFLGGKWSPFYWLNEVNMRKTLISVKNKVVISSYLNSYYLQSNNLLVPPLVDIEETKWKKELSTLPEVIRNHKGIKLIYAGNPARKDLLSNILQAVLSFNGKFQLIILGVNNHQGIGYADKELLEQYPDCIVFLGKIPQEDVPSYYKIADFSILAREPNRKNMAGFPTKIAESYAAGCPVILNGTSDLMDYVVDGKNAIVLKGYTSAAIKDGLQRIIEMNMNERFRISVEAEELGVQRFDYRRYKDAFKHFIINLEK